MQNVTVSARRDLVPQTTVLQTAPGSKDRRQANFAPQIAFRAANDAAFSMQPRPKASEDFDWWNGDTGPHAYIRRTLNGDFDFSVDLQVQNLSNNDWAGILLLDASDWSTHWAKIALSLKHNPGEPLVSEGPTPIVERVFNQGWNPNDPFLDKHAQFLGEGGETGERDFPEHMVAALSYAARASDGVSSAVGTLGIRRRGATVALSVVNREAGSVTSLAMRNFMPGPARIAFAYGYYPSQKSGFGGVTYTNPQLAVSP